MGGFCGWFDRIDTDPEPPATLGRMSARLRASAGASSRCHAAQGTALALRSGPTEGSWYCADGLVVALEGYPRWRRSDRHRKALTYGHARVLADAYQERHEDVLREVLGCFSFALLDHRRNTALLSIDRFGSRPLCYACPGERGLIFGSTADAVASHPAVTSTITPQTIYDYLYYVDRIPAPRTVYQEQRKLEPGACLIYKGGRCESRTYWRMPYSEDPTASTEDLAIGLRNLLYAAVARCLEGEDPTKIASFLSGGLDSSTVTGCLAQHSPQGARSFTIGFDLPAYDETDFAIAAARHFNVDHRVFRLTPMDELAAIPKVVEAFDEPFANSSAIPTYVCALHAREAGVHLMLAGDGGDELFAGNARYLKDAIFDHYERLPRPVRALVLEPLLALVHPNGWLPPAAKIANYVKYAKMSVPARLTHANLFSLVDPARVFAPEVLCDIDPGAPRALAEAAYQRAGAATKIQKMMNMDLQITLADGDLRKVGVMCELAGVRVKYPFLDDELAEFSARIPPRLLLSGRTLRSFYKRSLRGFLPPEVLRKKKRGFGLPDLEFVDSYRPLRDLVVDALTDLKGRRYFRKGFVDALIESTRDGRSQSFNGVAWDLMSLELWLQSRAIPK